MEIALVNPPRFEGIPVVREDRCEITERDSNIPPYSYLQLAAVLQRAGNEVRLIDANGFDLEFSELERASLQDSDIVFFRFTPTTFRSDIRIAEIAKRQNPNVTTIGACWTLRSYAQNVLEKAPLMDIYSIGDPLRVVPAVAESISERSPRVEFPPSNTHDRLKQSLATASLPAFPQEEVGIPPYDLLPNLDVYYSHVRQNSPYSILYFGKGCPYQCNFCTVNSTRFSSRAPQEVVEELSILKGKYRLRSFSFFDETFTMNRKKVIELCQLLAQERLDLRWFCETRVDRIDPELLHLMKKAGCHGISLGVESGSQKILDNVAKGVTVDQNRTGILMMKAAGIKVYANFILGLPGETPETIRETMALIRSTLPNGFQINIAQPYPGTAFFEMALDRGWLPSNLDWEELSQHKANISTTHITMELLERLRVEAYWKCLTDPRWVAMNLRWIFSNPGDLGMGLRYYMTAFMNFVLHGMSHAH
jgi:radical SAM superfamily enzyme YgiQ (UPF0313 family)